MKNRERLVPDQLLRLVCLPNPEFELFVVKSWLTKLRDNEVFGSAMWSIMRPPHWDEDLDQEMLHSEIPMPPWLESTYNALEGREEEERELQAEAQATEVESERERESERVDEGSQMG